MKALAFASYIRNKTLLISLGIFVGIVLTYLLFAPQWFFDGEDFGLLLKSMDCHSFKDFLNFFVYGDVNGHSTPIELSSTLVNQLPHQTPFVFYRPLVFVYLSIQYYFFGLTPSCFFITTIIIHAAIATLLFFGIKKFSNTLLALVCTLFFAFHPLLWGWLGKIDTQQHQFNVLFLLIAIIALTRWLESKQYSFYIVSIICFTICVLTRETYFIVPLFLFFFIPYLSSQKFSQWERIKICSGFLLPIMTSFFLRFTLYPTFSTAQHYILNSLFNPSMIASKIHSITTFLYNLFWLQWFSVSAYDFAAASSLLLFYRVYKGTILCLVILLLATNSQKKLLGLLCISIVALHWPLIFTPYWGFRFSYEALPLCAVTLACLVNYSRLQQAIRNIFLVLILTLIPFNASTIFDCMHRIMQSPQKIYSALMNARNNPKVELHSCPLLVIGTAHHHTHFGIIQALQVYRVNRTLPHYYLIDLKLHNMCSSAEIQKHLIITKENAHIRLKTRDKACVWFSIDTTNHDLFFLSDIVINEQTNDHKITDLTLVFDTAYYPDNLAIVTFVLDEEQFVVLG